MLTLIIFSVLQLLPDVYANGYLWIPPQRSSMWRAGYSVPVNYDDMSLNCGGFGNQWNVNAGRCGACGDPYQGPYENDNGGKYVTDIIGGIYNEGDPISLAVNLTAHHDGYFELRLCDNGSLTGNELQECLNGHPVTLQTPSGQSERFYPDNGAGLYTFPALLPDGVSCTHCVLQWDYRVGTNWGTDAEGTGSGHGPQEHFVNCADIQIRPVGVTNNDKDCSCSNYTDVCRVKSDTTLTCITAGAYAGQQSVRLA